MTWPDDEYDQTIGLPPERRAPGASPRATPPKTPVPPPSRPDPVRKCSETAEPPAPACAEDTLGLPPSPARQPAPRQDASSPAPRPAPPVRVLPAEDAPAPDPGWGRPASHLFAPDAPPRPLPVALPEMPAEEFQPWTIFPSAPRPAPEPPAPAGAELPPGTIGIREEWREAPHSKARPQATPNPPARPGGPGSSPRAEDGIEHTRVRGPKFVPQARAALLVLQTCDADGEWHDLEPIDAEGHVVGRGRVGRAFPEADSLAAEHAFIGKDGGGPFVEERNTINGVYLKLAPNQPVPLAPGTRFQVGRHVIEFRPAAPRAPVAALVSPDGEVFNSPELAALAFLDVVGPDNRPALSFPLTKLDHTDLGSKGETCDIALTGDDWASRRHARVSRRDGRFTLEDLGSTNGTFVRIAGRTTIRPGVPREPKSGDVLLLGGILFRVVEK